MAQRYRLQHACATNADKNQHYGYQLLTKSVTYHHLSFHLLGDNEVAVQ